MTTSGLLDRPVRSSPAFAEPTAERRRAHGFLAAILVAAMALTAWAIRGHTMWFDEIQAWNIARASHSLPGLLTNLRYEGHPALWYLPLYVLTRFSGDPRAMQLMEWLIVAGAYAVVLFRSPFSIGARVAIVAGYFVTFEYGIISRSYGLGMLLLLLALMWLARDQPAWGRGTTAVALMAWTSLAGAVLAFAIAGVVAWAMCDDVRTQRRLRAANRAQATFVAVITVATTASAISCLPPSDFVSFSLGIPTSPLGALSPTRVAASAAGPWRGLFPIPLGIGRWNTNVLDHLASAVWIQAALGIAVVTLVAVALRPHRFAFRLWMLGTIAYLAFSVAVVLPDRSHYAGESFLLFLACAWFALAPPGQARPLPRHAVREPRRSLPPMKIVAVVLGAQIIATMAILPNATVHPFSPDRALADAARASGLARDVVSGQDFDGVTISGFLDRPVYSVARGEWIRYFVNDQREASGNWRLTPHRIVCVARELAAMRARPAGVVVANPVSHREPVALVAARQGVYLYRVRPGPREPSTCR